MLKGAIDKPASAENGLDKRTAYERAVVELAGDELRLFQARLLENLISIVGLCANLGVQIRCLLVRLILDHLW